MLESKAADAALVRSARGGDRAAFGELYGRHKRMVHAVLLAHVAYADAEDLMQSVFVQALQRLSDLREPGAFANWLAAIARHIAADHYRRNQKVVEIDEVPDPRSAVAPREEAEQALEAIRSLPPTYRETLMMRLVEGMTGPEIAEKTGLTQDSVRVNLCRGMKMLRAQLGERSDG
jgi:RNA polymerase sigma-70 factor (ECF subfamily)